MVEVDKVSNSFSDGANIVSYWMNKFTLLFNDISLLEWFFIILFLIMLFFVVKLFGYHYKLKKDFGGFRRR